MDSEDNLDLLELLMSTVKDINQLKILSLPLKPKKSTIIYGENSSIDSLGLINLLVFYEERIVSQFNQHVDLFEEISNVKSHQLNLEDIANLAFQLIKKYN